MLLQLVFPSRTATISLNDMGRSIWIPFPVWTLPIRITGRRGRWVVHGVLLHVLTFALETFQPNPRRFPCLHGNLHCRWHHSRLCRNIRTFRRVYTTSELPDFFANRHSRWCPSFLEATVEPVRPTSHIPPVLDMQFGVQCGLCEKPGLWLYSCLSSFGGVLHFARLRDRECGGDGNFFQERPGSVYGSLDSDDHARNSSCAIPVWVRHLSGRL